MTRDDGQKKNVPEEPILEISISPGYFTREFHALQLIVLAVSGAVD